MDRRRMLLVAAALVAACGVVLTLFYVRGADARAASRFDTVPVLRAVAPIEAGETVDSAVAAEKIAVQQVARRDLLPDALTDMRRLDRLDGLAALTTIYPGEQIIAGRFGGQAEADSRLQIPDGKMAISVNLTDPARVAGFVNPGSEVSVFLNGTDPTTGRPFTRMLLRRVTVLGVGSTTPVSTTTTDEQGAQTTEQLPRTLLTLALAQDDAQKVLYAQTNGELAFGLLNGDSRVKAAPATTSTNLFG